MAIWKKTMMKMGAKKVTGLDVKTANSAVKIVDRMRRSHLGSRHWSEAFTTCEDWLNTKDRGKAESKPTLEIPCRLTAP